MQSAPTHYTHSPLKITIEGVAGPSGKTLMQFLLAEFLISKGHSVHLADTTTSPDILLDTMNWYHRGHYRDHMNTNPVEVYLAVTTTDTPVRADAKWIRWHDAHPSQYPQILRSGVYGECLPSPG